MWRFLTLIAVLAGLAQPVAGQDNAPTTAPGVDISDLLATLPEKSLKRLRDAPDRFVEEAVGLILGYGVQGGIGPDGIDRYIAVQRAKVRAREMRRLLLADLDNDGLVSEAEISVLIGAAQASSRGRLLLGFGAADLNGDNRVDLDELRRRAQSVAMEELSPVDAAALHGLMQLDLDRDGTVSVPEVMLTLSAFRHDV